MSGENTTIATSQGATLSFGNTIGHITAIDVTRSAGTIDTSDLTLVDGDPRSFEPMQLLDADEVKVEAIYSTSETYPAVGSAGNLTTSVGNVTGYAVVTSSDVKYTVGDVVKLSMVFKLGGTPD